jgi:hypothetical protein
MKLVLKGIFWGERERERERMRGKSCCRHKLREKENRKWKEGIRAAE